MENVVTYKSRTDGRRIFRLGGGVEEEEDEDRTFV